MTDPVLPPWLGTPFETDPAVKGLMKPFAVQRAELEAKGIHVPTFAEPEGQDGGSMEP